MQITTKLDLKKYIQYTFIGTFTSWFIIGMTVLMLLLFLYPVFLSVVWGTPMNAKFLFYILFMNVLFFGYVALLSYLNAKKRFKSHPKMAEQMIYNFSSSGILIQGETFKWEMSWKNIHKVKEIRGWILIYQNKSMANIIPVEAFGVQFSEFKSLVKSIPGVVYKFR